jgi:AraC-like DNA-binding protein
MKTFDKHRALNEYISAESEYFVYSPSQTALEIFLYPLQCGLFTYKPGYALSRESFDSFLIMYLQKGEMDLLLNGKKYHAAAGDFILIDCYKPHAYSSKTGCECLWCHYDGCTAKGYYHYITERAGNVFTISDPHPALNKLTALLRFFYHRAPIKEPLMSQYLTDILTEFMILPPINSRNQTAHNEVEQAISYINEHFTEAISIEDLAAKMNLSQYHFIRKFKRETGYTPHEYLNNTRIASASYLLKLSSIPIKEICYETGFASEAVFYNAFKRRMGITPMQYRSLDFSGRPDAPIL